ncbi:ead/Ea22-like family protein [Escherichia coli]|uniref:ead/Ea22-like family protein n=1 Tax=Escherichia coli TaxID=562 RepID=UPI0023EC7736|nr:ead/Ea22-like family protein [Escherichia coli]MDF4148269.1 ead/Ea22-like family protein [Escherichia coli]
MTKINYQALREAAERAIPAMERLLMLPVDDDLISEQELKDSGVDIDALNAFKILADQKPCWRYWMNGKETSNTSNLATRRTRILR